MILVPLLVYFAGIDIHTSIAASVAAFLFRVWLARLPIQKEVSFGGLILLALAWCQVLYWDRMFLKIESYFLTLLLL